MIDRSKRRVPVVLLAISGVLYMARGLMDLGDPMYYDPSTLFDYAAVIATTLSMVALAAAIASLAITRTVSGAARVVAWVPSAALALGGTANLLEDAFGMSALGFLYGVGGGLALVGVIALGVSTLLDGRNDRALGIALLLLGLVFTLPVFGRLAGVPFLCFATAYILGRPLGPTGEPEFTEAAAADARS